MYSDNKIHHGQNKFQSNTTGHKMTQSELKILSSLAVSNSSAVVRSSDSNNTVNALSAEKHKFTVFICLSAVKAFAEVIKLLLENKPF